MRLVKRLIPIVALVAAMAFIALVAPAQADARPRICFSYCVPIG